MKSCRKFPPLALLVAAHLVATAPLSGQQDSSMRVAVRLVTEGRGDSARALVRRRLAAVSTSDTSYAEVLYTAGVVASNPDSALRYLRRTTIEYSQSSWADKALLRIAQLSFASGDAATTFSSAERVITDYPFSPVRAQAAYWAGRAQIDLGNLPIACRYLKQAADSSADDVETANRARFYVQRCANLAAGTAKKDSVRRDSTPAAPPPTAKTPVAGKTPAPAAAATVAKTWAVQVAAVRSAAAADQSMQILKSAGFEPRVTRDSDGFFKVRAGSFKTKAEAQKLAADIKRKANLSPFLVEEP
jgi:hypothetical protein